MTRCPNDETLAAFIDGRLDGVDRQQVVQHLAECSVCREIVLMAGEVGMADGIDAPQNVIRPRFGQRWIAPAAVAAGLAIVAVLSRGWIESQWTGGMSDVVAAYEEAEKRQVHSRLSGFPYKPRKSVNRGPGDGGALQDPASWPLEQEQSKLEAVKSERSWREYRALAAARLLNGDRQGAVEAIEKAVPLAPENAAVANDLAAAYVERARRNPTHSGYVHSAISAAERAWVLERTPAAAWNRALAFGIAGRKAEAKKGWEEYLKLDPSSEWASEAQENLRDLQ